MSEFSLEMWKLVVSVMGIAIAVLVVIIQRKTEKLKISQSLLAESKTKAYSDVFDMFFELLKNIKNNRKHNEKQAMNRLLDAKKTIFIYGSDKVFKAMSGWLEYSGSTTEINPDKTLHLLYLLLIEMRKDLGYKNTKISYEDFIVYLMQNREEVTKFNTI